jgi:hypothetical protein
MFDLCLCRHRCSFHIFECDHNICHAYAVVPLCKGRFMLPQLEGYLSSSVFSVHCVCDQQSSDNYNQEKKRERSRVKKNEIFAYHPFNRLPCLFAAYFCGR